MGWYEEFQKTIGEAARQIKGSGHPVYTTASPRNSEVSFTKNAQTKMKQWGRSEGDALDVYFHGSVVKQNMMVRKYNGYELGIWFFADRVTDGADVSPGGRVARMKTVPCVSERAVELLHQLAAPTMLELATQRPYRKREWFQFLRPLMRRYCILIARIMRSISLLVRGKSARSYQCTSPGRTCVNTLPQMSLFAGVHRQFALQLPENRTNAPDTHRSVCQLLHSCSLLGALPRTHQKYVLPPQPIHASC